MAGPKKKLTAEEKQAKMIAALDKRNNAASKIQRQIRRHQDEKRQEAELLALAEQAADPDQILQEQARKWQEGRRAARLPGYVGSLFGGSSPRKDRTKGLSRYEILMSGDYHVLRGGERPIGFGPDGPSDKELVYEIVQMHRSGKLSRMRARASKTSRLSDGGPQVGKQIQSARTPSVTSDSEYSSEAVSEPAAEVAATGNAGVDEAALQIPVA